MIRYRPDELPYFWQWRMVGEGAYVMGLEPANCPLMGRGEARRQGRLPMLAAGKRGHTIWKSGCWLLSRRLTRSRPGKLDKVVD